MNLKIRTLIKNNTKQTLRLTASILLLAIVLFSCTDTNELGLEVLPTDDLISVKELIIQDDITAFTYSEDNLISSGGTSLIGSFNDPNFGDTDIDFAAQYRLVSYPNFGTNTVVDSVRLYLYYRSVYGDTLTEQNFKVYELSSSLDPATDYTQDIDLKSMSYEELLGEVSHIPKLEIDTLTGDTAYQSIVIPINNSLGDKLVNTDSTILINNDSLLTIFKGLFVETEKAESGDGSILTLSTASTSRLVVFYNNDENTEADTLYTSFIITDNSARVNSISHDYSGTPFEPNLNQQVVQDENIYVQPTGGLKTLVLIENLESWRDSLNIGINKAELVFQTDTIASDIENFAPPSQLLFTFIDDEGNEKIPLDYYFSPNFYGGYLYSNYQYRFNITQHLQAIIDGEVENNGFYLSTGRRTPSPNRVILESPTKGSGIKLYVTYSKFFQ